MPAMKFIHIACAILVPLLWGVQYAVIKAGLAVFPPLFFAGLRFAVIALIVIPVSGRLAKREVVPVAFISIFMGGVNFGGSFIGLTHSPAGIAGVAIQLWTPITLVLAWPLLGERPSARVIVGVALAFVGVLLAVADPSAAVPVVPTLFVIGSAFGLAAGNVLTKMLGRFDPVKLFAWMSLFTAPQLLLLSLCIESGQVKALFEATATEWMAFTYTVFLGGIAAFSIWFWLISRFSMARVAPYTLLQSFFSIVAGVGFRHEALTPALIAGALICVAGVALTQIRLSGPFSHRIHAP
jgi:O-acetylserine/cysteine efflux transporter